MSRTYRLQGFVIRRRNFAEADRLITFFSREKGKITLKAKGIRKLQSRRSGLLELFNEVSILVAKGRAGDIVTEVFLDQNYQNFATDYQKTKLGYQLIELINKLAPEEEVNEEIYELLKLAFEYLQSRELALERCDTVLLRFNLRLLELLGFGTPPIKTLTETTAFIENVLERKLMSADCYDI
ncbi:DNA repair protein RecO [Candidatus Beckwithbacteria bacterium]|nr:DNA repair protein RecO [Candidatus Beckwithbacteria bacterium]